MLVQDFGQASGVGIVHLPHSMVVALEQGAIGGQLGSHSLIFLLHAYQLTANGIPAVHHCYCIVVNDRGIDAATIASTRAMVRTAWTRCRSSLGNLRSDIPTVSLPASPKSVSERI
jgi:hypothetical protein